ncbi:MAG: asparagine synthetase B, partial [Acidobacteria bacterium]|nr:asparagine synthetase B [Acidobacteriota bacterium]
MSVQFGRWNFEGRAEKPLSADRLRQQLAPYGRDGEGRFAEEGIDLLFYRLGDTEDSCRSEQPFRMGPSQFLMWDGRLDNRDDLLRELRGSVPSAVSDISIVAAAYARWGQACFRKLVGDWALSVWDGRRRELVLAKDFLGTRPLFYFVEKTLVQWSSILDPLVLFAGRRFPLNREYLAGWFGLFPAAPLTPYIGIHSVPPASYVVVRRDSVETRAFWQFEPVETLRYATDAEYEAHFLALFRQSVRRRLRSPFPVMAELSGGVDSSSIVCVADRILTESEIVAPRVDTITYYSTIEPNWDELPYVEKVEKLRGKTGHRIEVRSDDVFHCDADTSHFMATPGALDSESRSALEFSRVFAETGSRVLLSGVGGDEVLGGAPSPFPQLADLFARGCLRELLKQS